ncbi:MAG: hypothetical protein PHX08_00860 [Lachnospiraceae bacterium]|nr:hypothetical protein [Lachnospiraceae bacterium]
MSPIQQKDKNFKKRYKVFDNGKVEYENVADEINRPQELKQNALAESAQREELKQRISEMTEFLSQTRNLPL